MDLKNTNFWEQLEITYVSFQINGKQYIINSLHGISNFYVPLYVN